MLSLDLAIYLSEHPELKPTLVQFEAPLAEINGLRPLPPHLLGKITQKFHIDWNYHSNAIEGNTLTHGETRAFLLEGITAKGKPFRDYLDIQGHEKAIQEIEDLVKRPEEPLTAYTIRSLHNILLGDDYEVKAQTPDGLPTTRRIQSGQYKSSPNHVITATGKIHYYEEPENVPQAITDLLDWLKAVDNDSRVHPLVKAALFHHRFVAIHPFDDGNGRMTRLLMNLILMRAGYPVLVIPQERRGEYYAALNQADVSEYEPFILLLSEFQQHALELYLRGSKGESIEELSDLDKKIALFKQQIKTNESLILSSFSPETANNLLQDNINPFLESLKDKLHKKFGDLFVRTDFYAIKFDNENHWFYEKKNPHNLNIDDVLTVLENFPVNAFYRSCDYGLIYSFIMSDFIVESNPFSIELKIIISFNKFQYTIDFMVSTDFDMEGKSILDYYLIHKDYYIQNHYHNNILLEQRQRFEHDIINNLFHFIENTYAKNENSILKPRVSEIIIEKAWDNCADSWRDPILQEKKPYLTGNWIYLAPREEFPIIGQEEFINEISNLINKSTPITIGTQPKTSPTNKNIVAFNDEELPPF